MPAEMPPNTSPREGTSEGSIVSAQWRKRATALIVAFAPGADLVDLAGSSPPRRNRRWRDSKVLPQLTPPSQQERVPSAGYAQPLWSKASVSKAFAVAIGQTRAKALL